MRSHHKFVLGIAMVILLVSTSLIIVGSKPPPAPAFKGSVKDLLPTAEKIPGWKVEYLPIAQTPEIQAKVNEALNYDDAVFAVYTSGSTRLSVYIAYWRPGKMPHRFVASHTPDVCWVRSGWSIFEARSGTCFSDGLGGQLPPAEERIMIMHGSKEHVAFWHLLDGEPMSYGILGVPPWYAPITDLFNRKLSQKPEQFFIRISSNEEIKNWPTIDVYRYLSRSLPLRGQIGTGS